MSINPFRQPGSGAPATRSLLNRAYTINRALEPLSNVGSPVPPQNPLVGVGAAKVLGGAAIAGAIINAGSTAKSDLESVTAQLGYSPKMPVIVEPEIPAQFTGGQSSTLYAVTYRALEPSMPNNVCTLVERDRFISGWHGPIGALEGRNLTWVPTSGSTAENEKCRSYAELWILCHGQGNGARLASQQWVQVTTAQAFKSIVSVTVTPWGGGADTGGNLPPIQRAVIAPPAPDVFIPPQPVTPTTKPPTPVKEPVKEDKKIAPPPFLQPSKDSSSIEYPETTNTTTGFKPGQIAPTPVNNPGKTTNFIPGAQPSPALKPLDPGTTRTTRFLPPTDDNKITLKEPYLVPRQREEPKVAPLPLPIPQSPIPAKLDCQELLDCLGGLSPTEPQTETVSLPIYACNLETGEIETTNVSVTVPANSAEYLQLLFENFQPLIEATCPEIIEVEDTFIPAISSFYEQTDPNIEYVKLEIIEPPIDRKTIPAGQIKDYTYFSGWFSWLKDGIKANQEESINKQEQMFFKPKNCNGFRYYCLYGATIACTIYKRV